MQQFRRFPLQANCTFFCECVFIKREIIFLETEKYAKLTITAVLLGCGLGTATLR